MFLQVDGFLVPPSAGVVYGDEPDDGAGNTPVSIYSDHASPDS